MGNIYVYNRRVGLIWIFVGEIFVICVLLFLIGIRLVVGE